MLLPRESEMLPSRYKLLRERFFCYIILNALGREAPFAFSLFREIVLPSTPDPVLQPSRYRQILQYWKVNRCHRRLPRKDGFSAGQLQAGVQETVGRSPQCVILSQNEQYFSRQQKDLHSLNP